MGSCVYYIFWCCDLFSFTEKREMLSAFFHILLWNGLTIFIHKQRINYLLPHNFYRPYSLFLIFLSFIFICFTCVCVIILGSYYLVKLPYSLVSTVFVFCRTFMYDQIIRSNAQLSILIRLFSCENPLATAAIIIP